MYGNNSASEYDFKVLYGRVECEIRSFPLTEKIEFIVCNFEYPANEISPNRRVDNWGQIN